MINALTSPRRLGRSLGLAGVIALVAGAFTALPAQALTTCAFLADIDPGAPVVGQVTLTLGADDNTAIAIRGGLIQFTQDANLQTATWNNCTPAAADAATQVVRINGSNAGNETLRIVQVGDGVSDDLSDQLTFIDLGTNTGAGDSVQFLSAHTILSANPTPFNDLLLGTAVGGTLVGAPDSDFESDYQFTNVENFTHVGGTTAVLGDFVDAQAPSSISRLSARGPRTSVFRQRRRAALATRRVTSRAQSPSTATPATMSSGRGTATTSSTAAQASTLSTTSRRRPQSTLILRLGPQPAVRAQTRSMMSRASLDRSSTTICSAPTSTTLLTATKVTTSSMVAMAMTRSSAILATTPSIKALPTMATTIWKAA
jgi:hypothetical protein